MGAVVGIATGAALMWRLHYVSAAHWRALPPGLAAAPCPAFPHHRTLARAAAPLAPLDAQEEIDHALTHELVHAYDHCRAKNIDWTDCRHHACSEIRAAMLSGRRRCCCLL